MSTTLANPAVTDEGLRALLDSQPVKLHYIAKRQFASAVLDGGVTLALCGHTWYPQATDARSGAAGPSRAEVICDACHQIYNTLPSGPNHTTL